MFAFLSPPFSLYIFIPITPTFTSFLVFFTCMEPMHIFTTHTHHPPSNRATTLHSIHILHCNANPLMAFLFKPPSDPSSAPTTALIFFHEYPSAF